MTVRETNIETPMGHAKGTVLSDYVVLAPVLRAGLIMARSGPKNYCPRPRIYHVGLKRDEETLEAKTYYDKLPEALPKRLPRHSARSNAGYRRLGC